MQQTPDLLENLRKVSSTALSLTHFAKIEDKNSIAKEKQLDFFFISYNNLFSGLGD